MLNLRFQDQGASSIKGRSKPDSSCLHTKKVAEAYFAVVDLYTEPEQRQDMVCHFCQQRQNPHIQVILMFQTRYHRMHFPFLYRCAKVHALV